MENAVAYVKKSFLAGREINRFEELAPAAGLWLETVANVREHAQTHERPIDRLAGERSQLLPLNPRPYAAVRTLTVRFSLRCRVTIESNRYSVPMRHAGALLTLQLSSDHVRLYADTTLVAEHVRSYARRADLDNPDHLRELEERRRGGERERLLLSFLELSPAAGPYHRGLQERRMNAGHHLARILALVPAYGAAAVGDAIDNAHQLGHQCAGLQLVGDVGGGVSQEKVPVAHLHHALDFHRRGRARRGALLRVELQVRARTQTG